MHRFIVAILLLAAPHGAFASPGALFAEPDFFTLGPGIGLDSMIPAFWAM